MDFCLLTGLMAGLFAARENRKGNGKRVRSVEWRAYCMKELGAWTVRFLCMEVPESYLVYLCGHCWVVLCWRA